MGININHKTGVLTYPTGSTPADIQRNLVVWWTGNNTASITADAITLYNSTFTIGRVFTSVSESVDISASVGANGPDESGLDTANVFRYIYLIAKSSDGTINALISASSTSPILPSGYDLFVLVDACRNDASSNFTKWVTVGKRHQLEFDAGNKVVDGGTATSATDVDVSGVVPPIARHAFFYVMSYTTSDTTMQTFLIDKTLGISVTFDYINTGLSGGSLSAKSTYTEAPINSDQVLQYKISSGTGHATTLWVMGWVNP